MHINIITNIPADTHPDFTRMAFAIADAFGARVFTATREEMFNTTPETRSLLDCEGCGDLHYAPLCSL